MTSWIHEAVDNISNGKRVHGVVMLELIDLGLAKYSDNTERQALTREGMAIFNEIENMKI